MGEEIGKKNPITLNDVESSCWDKLQPWGTDKPHNWSKLITLRVFKETIQKYMVMKTKDRQSSCFPKRKCKLFELNNFDVDSEKIMQFILWNIMHSLENTSSVSKTRFFFSLYTIIKNLDTWEKQ